MPQPVVDQAVLEVSFDGRHQGQRVLTVLHFKAQPTIGSFVDFNTAADDFLDGLLVTAGLYESYLECLSEEYSAVAIRLQLITPVRYAFKVYPQPTTTGAVAEPALPPNEGAMIVKRTDETGRRQRGAVHMPAIPITFQDGGVLLAVGISAYNVFGEKLANPITTTAGGGEVLWSPVIFNRDTPNLSPVVEQASVQPTTRTNRRRTVGVGE